MITMSSWHDEGKRCDIEDHLHLSSLARFWPCSIALWSSAWTPKSSSTFHTSKLQIFICPSRAEPHAGWGTVYSLLHSCMTSTFHRRLLRQIEPAWLKSRAHRSSAPESHFRNIFERSQVDRLLARSFSFAAPEESTTLQSPELARTYDGDMCSKGGHSKSPFELQARHRLWKPPLHPGECLKAPDSASD